MTTEKQYPDFCVANYSSEHFKATKKVLAGCGIELRYLMPQEDYKPKYDPDNPKGIRVKGKVATVCVTDDGFRAAQIGTPLTIKTRNIYRHVGKLNIFDSAELTDYSPNIKAIELKPLVKYTPKGIKTSLFKKLLITLKAIINHFR
ncbi:hypothetical protein 3043_13 [Acinetobacter phage vB_Api_3043-K38]|uniref:Uncharacterized protein n=1 Tax=Acinetobacter phage vB_Api_3043-K38 TaxID=2862717 RepID=A0AC61N8T4_9CAUD|nr:hypothetical protein 3043_13 [Acinetobacter phage vB_Api_3043-K38]